MPSKTAHSTFNEDSRVKIPTLLHLMRLGYEYISLKDATYDINTNIFTDIFQSSIQRINPHLTKTEVDEFIESVKITLENEDLGEQFYEMLTARSSNKLIDFTDITKNSLHVVTELTYKNGDDEFRPDITLLINGMPLVFIEVKKPNNKDGILAEQERIIKRFKNSNFRRFINITQFMIFSNNMEYAENASSLLEGAFYASSSYIEPKFNYFREEMDLSDVASGVVSSLPHITDEQENSVLIDTNLTQIKHTVEFVTNKSPDTPTNRICTSLCMPSRLFFFLQYALAYVRGKNGLEKHMMRYPQFFATKAIEAKLGEGIRKGIVWHTQGSGKTALAYYNTRFLTHFYNKQNIVPKFYFIVDRIDLLEQAQREFTSRGLIVHTIDSRDKFQKDIKSPKAKHNDSGKLEITVVNIQKFQDDPTPTKASDYAINIQRIYFLDEVHRSYKPTGSFLANLEQSDRNAIKIGLTGTPLLSKEYNSRQIFGDYFHKYFYNASIADGYTLRLMREEIETNYKLALQEALANVELEQGQINRQTVYAHKNFVNPMLEYILTDFEKSRIAYGDSSIGAMVICDSSNQAKQMYQSFQEMIYSSSYQENSKNTIKTASLILHDIGSKDDRKEWVIAFKDGKIDILFVYNMLLTGFDAHRLKKLYLGRRIKNHNLLQALTRVNRPYKEFSYGYVVDFADIREDFDAVNRAYQEELKNELGDEMEKYSHLFKSKEEIEKEIEEIKDILFQYDTTNAEIFSKQISEIQDTSVVLALKKALDNVRSLYNIIRLQGDNEFIEQLDFKVLEILYRETSNHLDLLNLKNKLSEQNSTENLLNIALEDILFLFKKVGEKELILADELKNVLRITRETLGRNFDQQDPVFISLKEELERIFKKRNINEVSQEEMSANKDLLSKILEQAKELNIKNNLIRAKYNDDAKFARIHKRLSEFQPFSAHTSERRIFEALNALKPQIDNRVLESAQILENEAYFEKMIMPLMITEFNTKQKIAINTELAKKINKLITTEYLQSSYDTGAFA